MTDASQTARLVTFGREEYMVEEFTLDQLRRLSRLVNQFMIEVATGDRDDKAFPAASGVLEEALGKSAEEISATRTDIDELYRAVEAIADLAGLKKLGERFRKEKEEREARAKAGTTFTPS